MTALPLGPLLHSTVKTEAIWRRLAKLIIVVPTLAFTLFIFVTTIFFVITTHFVLPQEDEWTSLALLQRLLDGHGLVSGLLSQHNEHRIFFPRLVLFADYLFFGGRDDADIAVIFVIQGLTTTLLLFLLARSGIASACRAALGAVIVVLMFSLRQSENLVWGFQVQFVGVFASAALSITLFARGLAPDLAPRHAWTWIAAAFVLAGVATFSMANGTLVGVVLAILACVARARFGFTLATVLVAAALIACFAIGYHLDEGHEGPSGWLRHAPRILFFTAAYLGDFLDGDLRAAAWVGGCGLAVLAAIAVPAVLGRDRDPVRLALIGIALFAAGSAFVTALGRSSDGVGGAMASRYATGAALFWCATLVGAFSWSKRPPLRIPIRIVAFILAAVLLRACWAVQIPTAVFLQQRATAFEELEIALVQGLYDEPALAARDIPIDIVRRTLPLLKERHLSIFSTRDAHLLGRNIAEAGNGPRLACSGSFSDAVSEPALGHQGVAVLGTSDPRNNFPASTRIYIADADDRIVGLAQTGYDENRWKGKAIAAPGVELRAFARSTSGSLCAIGASTVLEDVTE